MTALVALIGFIIGAIGPLLMGIGAQQELQAFAAAAQAKGEMVCGLPAIVPMALLFVVTPLGGLIGATVGAALASAQAPLRVHRQDDIFGE